MSTFPITYKGLDIEASALKLEDMVYHHINQSDSDYLTMWASELLYDVDFYELVKRLDRDDE